MRLTEALSAGEANLLPLNESHKGLRFVVKPADNNQ
jgi:hypothetical protein